MPILVFLRICLKSQKVITQWKQQIYLFTRCKDTEMNKDVWLNSSVSGVRVMVFNDTFNSTNVFQLYRGGKFYWRKNPEYL